ncbi:RNA-binding protein 33, partial [Dissostichus eleginoides]
MTENTQEYGFGEYDKPGAERSRRRRGEDDDLGSDLEEDLLGEDWLSGKKNPSEVSDEELNDDLLQSDDEEVTMSGQGVNVNATVSLGASSQVAEYAEDVPHQQQMHSQHHPSRPRGPPPFQDHGRAITQQPLQPLIPQHMAHRSPPMRPQMEPPPRMMKGQRHPLCKGPGDFQQHMSGNFGQSQRPLHHMEPFRNQPSQGPQDREPLFMSERAESTRFPGQHMFDHQGPNSLMNRPTFNQPGLGLFPREPPRPNLPPHQGHQGMVGMNQQGPPNQPRPFMGPRQPFGQQGNLFPPPDVQFGMQGLMGPPQVHGGPRQMSPRPQNPQQRNMSNRQRMNTPMSKQMQHRNSNLRELPVAPANTNMNINNARPAANMESQTPGGRTVVRKEIPRTPLDPNEDEETRQYRLKIEEQKRLREEILKTKEMRRQMQAGRRNSVQIRPGAQIQTVPQKNIPVTPQIQTPGPPQTGAKRTVMQRTKSVEDQQVPQKVRVVKLSGAGVGVGVGNPVQQQQQGTWTASPLTQRKVTMAGQQGPVAAAPAGRGVTPQQNRVVVSARGRGRGVAPIGRGRPMSTRQSPKAAETERCTVSIEGLSSSTTDAQLQNLLRSIGPIE